MFIGGDGGGWGFPRQQIVLFRIILAAREADNDELYISRTYEAVAFEMKYLMNELYSENSQYIEDC